MTAKRFIAAVALLTISVTTPHVTDPIGAETEAEAGAGAETETPAVRTYFYVGGEYADDGSGGHIFREQMYVERLRPVDGVKHETPLVMIHGQGQTGT
ncbi:hypothetical protein E4U54_005892, partial [Claviceps lovelessii]